MNDRPTRLSDSEQHGLARLTNDEIAALEAQNAVAQVVLAEAVIRAQLSSGTPFELTPSLVCELNRKAVAGLEPTAGLFRMEAIEILGSRHSPPDWREIKRHLDEVCAYIHSHRDSATALHLAAFAMWRVAWIHPFSNGNGRTSRATGFVVLCCHLNMELPGTNTFLETLIRERRRYYRALQDADGVWLRKKLFDVSKLEDLLAELLQEQLSSLDDQG